MIESALVLLLAVGAFGVGLRLLRLIDADSSDRLEAGCFGLALGFGALALAVFALGVTSLLYRWVVVAATVVWFAIGLSPSYRAAGDLVWWLKGRWVVPYRSVYFWVGLIALAAMMLNWVRAIVPVHGATDPLAYHLALPKIYLRAHTLSFEPTVNGALYPSNMGLLYVVAIALKNGIVAQTLHWLMAVLTCVAIIGFCRGFFTLKTGAWAAAVFSFVPVVVAFSPQGYVDLGLGFFQFCALWAILRWARSPGTRALVTAAILTGLAMGVKHQGLSTLLLGAAVVGLVGVRAHGFRWGARQLGLYAGLSCLLLAPWYLRAYLFAGNPVWPLANGFFGGVAFGRPPTLLAGGPQQSPGVLDYLVSIFLPLEWLRVHWHSFSLWSWTFEPVTLQRAVGGYFLALLPGLAIFARTRRTWAFIGFCGAYYVILIRFLHMNPRYGIALLAFAAVLCGLVAERMASCRVPGVATVFKIVFMATGLVNLTWSYAQAKDVAEVAFGAQSREDFLNRTESNYRLFQYINHNTPQTATVLLQGIVKGYYCDRRYLWDHPFQSVLSYEGEDATSLYHRMRELGITHIARMINIPQTRLVLGYPQYFVDPLHEEFRKRFLNLEYYDRDYALFSLRGLDDA